MRNTILLLTAGGLILAGSGTANAQNTAPTGDVGSGVRSQDVAASNRQFDNDYNTIASRGVKVTNMDRADSKRAAKGGSPVLATAEDIKAGAQVRDVKGVSIGTIATLASNEVVADPSQTVIDTGHGKIGVPLSAFGKDAKGLMLSITAEKFNELVAQANTKAPTP
jgi:hypothetical protein